MAALKQKLSGLARVLVSYNLLDAEHTKKAFSQAKIERIPFTSYLVRHKILTASIIAQTVIKDFSLPLLDLAHYETKYIPKELIDKELSRRHHVLPLFKRGGSVFVALTDPTNQIGLNEIQFSTGLSTLGVVVEEDKFANLLNQVLSELTEKTSALDNVSDEEFSDAASSSHDDTELTEDEVGSEVDDAPIVRLVNKVLIDAINKGASDIHFEPYEKTYRIRLRQDGILHAEKSPPKNLAASITSRLKVISKLDISERRIPQDGRFKIKVSPEKSIDLRISTCPTVGGEKVVMRVLDPSSASIGIENLGYMDEQKKLFMDAIHKPQGMVLVTGPTGSGKTVSLYTALNILNKPELNISTAEDPVEIKLDGINQVQVNPKTGMTFPAALKSFLRQDPDIIMVGEIRDLETAEIAIKASQTGHLVLSTLHTNSAAETLTRLISMGIPSFSIATSTSLVIAQRLARRLCDHCKQTAEVPNDVLIEAGFDENELEGLQLFEAIGCESCVAGYKGRIGIYEVLPVTPAICEIIMANGNSIDICKQAQQEGMLTLRRSGLIRTKEGLTSLQEINRVTKG